MAAARADVEAAVRSAFPGADGAAIRQKAMARVLIEKWGRKAQ
ncbi:hypothetical protein ACFPOE_10240 [Caenimonas terrae]|uniref:Uncharacterized protein n=1 Tax=Caenimonas terrae TaxID=696074 RepID=A0ABW0NB57_9BURK